jgi:hypothetical protein
VIIEQPARHPNLSYLPVSGCCQDINSQLPTSNSQTKSVVRCDCKSSVRAGLETTSTEEGATDSAWSWELGVDEFTPPALSRRTADARQRRGSRASSATPARSPMVDLREPERSHALRADSREQLLEEKRLRDLPVRSYIYRKIYIRRESEFPGRASQDSAKIGRKRHETVGTGEVCALLKWRSS